MTTNAQPDQQPRARTRIKICGIRDPIAAQAAVESGADAVGLVFAPGSPRLVSTNLAAQIIRVLPPFVEPVALFVNHPADQIRRTAAQLGLRTVQLHGHEPPEILTELPNLRVIKALPFSPTDLDHLINPWRPSPTLPLPNLTAILWDTPPSNTPSAPPQPTPEKPSKPGANPGGGPGVPGVTSGGGSGGTGRKFDWEPLANAQHSGQLDGLPPSILAGGLTPHNVAHAIQTVRPFAVDVSSGVESSRGVKDPTLIRNFCLAVQKADANLA